MLAHHPAQVSPLATELYRSKSGELIAACSIRPQPTSPERLAAALFGQLKSLSPAASHVVADLTHCSGPIQDGLGVLIHAPQLFKTLSIVTREGELPPALALLGLRNIPTVKVFRDLGSALNQWNLASDQPIEVPLGKLAGTSILSHGGRSEIESARFPPRNAPAQISGTLTTVGTQSFLRIESSTKKLSDSDTLALKNLLTAHAEDFRPLHLDLSALDGVDKGALTAFVALKKTLQAKGSDLYFGQLSEKLRTSLEPLGFVRHFAAPSHKAA